VRAPKAGAPLRQPTDVLLGTSSFSGTGTGARVQKGRTCSGDGHDRRRICFPRRESVFTGSSEVRVASLLERKAQIADLAKRRSCSDCKGSGLRSAPGGTKRKAALKAAFRFVATGPDCNRSLHQSSFFFCQNGNLRFRSSKEARADLAASRETIPSGNISRRSWPSRAVLPFCTSSACSKFRKMTTCE